MVPVQLGQAGIELHAEIHPPGSVAEPAAHQPLQTIAGLAGRQLDDLDASPVMSSFLFRVGDHGYVVPVISQPLGCPVQVSCQTTGDLLSGDELRGCKCNSHSN